MALPLRPRSFVERPKSATLTRQPANDNAGDSRKTDTESARGRMENGVFRFASPAAQEQWVRDAYQLGINADTWHLGDKIDNQTASLALAGLGGPMPTVYLGPDNSYRTINQKTIESAGVRDHRNRHLTGKTIDQIAAAGKMPGEDEWLEQWRAMRAANENVSSQNLEKSEGLTADESGDERPGLGTRFGASARKSLVDDTVIGNAFQQFKSGHAVSPDVLATRPSDRFLQLGSKGMLEWHRMFEPLGIAGGKRRIDFLSPEERKQWESMWEALPADQQAAYRAMWDEKQQEYRPWREDFERKTAMPAPETVAEFATDISGSIFGSMASPESWIGILPKTSVQALRAARPGFIDDGTLKAGKAVGSKHALDEVGADIVTIQPVDGRDILKLLPNENTRRLTEKDVYALTGEDRGFAFVLETPRGKPESIAWEDGVRGRLKDIETQKTLSPSLLYRNSNEKGLHVAKFDGYQPPEESLLLLMIDAKRRYPFFFNAGARRDTTRTILRWLEALEQNPGYGIVIEFPNSVEMLLAQVALKEFRTSNRIFARVRPDE